MKNLFLVFLISILASATAFAQEATQTIRGRVVDEASKSPLAGATIVVLNKDSSATLGTTSDAEGNFKIPNVPLGRQTLKVLYYGYEEYRLPDITVTAGKEVILNVGITENISQLDDVTIIYDRTKDKNVTNNPLSMVSAPSFNLEDTKRYAGALLSGQ